MTVVLEKFFKIRVKSIQQNLPGTPATLTFYYTNLDQHFSKE